MFFGYDYKQDLEKTALERERIFRLRNIRQETVESDDDTFFDKAVEDEKPVVETALVPDTTIVKKEKRSKMPKEEEEDEEEQAEFPDELPAGFGMMKFAGART